MYLQCVVILCDFAQLSRFITHSHLAFAGCAWGLSYLDFTAVFPTVYHYSTYTKMSDIVLCGDWQSMKLSNAELITPCAIPCELVLRRDREPKGDLLGIGYFHSSVNRWITIVFPTLRKRKVSRNAQMSVAIDSPWDCPSLAELEWPSHWYNQQDAPRHVWWWWAYQTVLSKPAVPASCLWRSRDVHLNLLRGSWHIWTPMSMVERVGSFTLTI